jgi:hypothetical protein
MNEGISETKVVFSGQIDDYSSTGLKSRKVPDWKEEEIMKRRIEERRKRIQPIYNSQGKIIEYSDFGRHLDFLA